MTSLQKKKGKRKKKLLKIFFVSGLLISFLKKEKKDLTNDDFSSFAKGISCHRKAEAPLEVDGGEMFPRECKHSPPLQFCWHLDLLNLFGGSRLLVQHRYYVCRRHFWCSLKLGPK